MFRSLPKHTPKELSDFLAVHNGRAIFIEVKGEKGRQSNDQLAFPKRCSFAGAEYFVARGEDVQRPHDGAGMD